MSTGKLPTKFFLSRRSLLRAVGGAAIAGLSGCSAAPDAPDGSPSPPPGPPAQQAAVIKDGYTDQQSYRPGDTVTLFLSAKDENKNMGWSYVPLYDYANNWVLQIQANLIPQFIDSSTPSEFGFGYEANASFIVPSDLRSGVYLVDGLVPVIVKAPPTEPVDMVIVYPSNTSAAYNDAGGRSLYTADPATGVSFLRPAGGNQLSFFNPFLIWMARLDLPYRIRYVADIDLDDYDEIGDAKLLVIIGHSEYWTRAARENFDQFVLSGGNALMLSGNNMWWQVRYSRDRTRMICYKLVHDPFSNPLLHTINWPNPKLKYSVLHSLGADFPHGGYGEGYEGYPTPGWKGFRVVLPHSPVFRGVSIKHGDIISMPTIEYDGTPLLNDPLSSGEDPKIDMAAIGAYRAEIIGYDYGFRNGANRIGTWLAMQRTATSGVVMNGASTNWCDQGVIGADREIGQKVILNMIHLMVNNESVFSS
jgi:hypothetical protein